MGMNWGPGPGMMWDSYRTVAGPFPIHARGGNGVGMSQAQANSTFMNASGFGVPGITGSVGASDSLAPTALIAIGIEPVSEPVWSPPAAGVIYRLRVVPTTPLASAITGILATTVFDYATGTPDRFQPNASPSFNAVHVPDEGGLVGCDVTNALPVPIWLCELTGTGLLQISVAVPSGPRPPISPTGSPTVVPLPPTTPAPAIARVFLEKKNPGFVAELTRQEHYEDLGIVQLGHRVNLTSPAFGCIGRGHVITGIDIDMVATERGDAPEWTLTSKYTLEKIPGTVLPGTGTSTAGQDQAGLDAGTGAELRRYFTWGTGLKAGWGIGVWGKQ